MTNADTADTVELLPCPFCGGKAQFDCIESEDGDDPNEGGHCVACSGCGACSILVFACGDDPLPILAEKWNRRAFIEAAPEKGGEIARLAKEYAGRAEALASAARFARAGASDERAGEIFQAQYVHCDRIAKELNALLSAHPAAAKEPGVPLPGRRIVTPHTPAGHAQYCNGWNACLDALTAALAQQQNTSQDATIADLQRRADFEAEGG